MPFPLSLREVVRAPKPSARSGQLVALLIAALVCVVAVADMGLDQGRLVKAAAAEVASAAHVLTAPFRR